MRGVRVGLPNLDERRLEDVDELRAGIGGLSGFRFDDAERRSLELSGQRLSDGLISGLRVRRADLAELRLTAVEWSGCDLPSLLWRGGTLSRVRFTDCRILSGAFIGLTLAGVVFDRCKLDLTSFTDIATKGPVVFRECSLGDVEFTGGTLGQVVFDDCRMRSTTFARGIYTGMDLRGNDLSAVRGVSALREAVIDPAQTIELGQALASDLNLSFRDD